MKKADKDDDDQKRRNDELNQLRIRPVSLSSLPSSCPDCGFVIFFIFICEMVD